MLYHLRPSWVPGGFVGVDVFFVISGFLITGSLRAQLIRSGTVRLAAFWGRRIRRLLPGAALVLIAVVVAAPSLLPKSEWSDILRQTLASAVSLQNWVLAADSVSYLHPTALPSPLQHFWSLSVEEQFYVVLPLVILAVVWIARRATVLPASVLRFVIPALALVSFVYSIVASQLSPGLAYFSTFTRAWELLLGATLAMWMPLLAIGRRASVGLVVGGGVAVLASLWVVNDSMPFPGYAALLPTLGAAALLLGGPGAAGSIPARALTLRPVTWVGDISYSLYLWHWPFIVVTASLLGVAILPPLAAAGALAASLVIATCSKYFVEDVFQRTRPSRAEAGASPFRRALVHPFALGAVLLAFVGASCWPLGAAIARETAVQVAIKADYPGGRLLDPSFDLSTFPDIPAPPLPNIVTLRNSVERQLTSECLAGAELTTVTTCTAGDPKGRKTVLIAGDSHAAQWLPAFDQLGKDKGWKIVLAAKQSCPLATVPEGAADIYPIYPKCVTWNQGLRALLARVQPDLLFTSAAYYGYPPGSLGSVAFDTKMGAEYAQQYAFAHSLGIPVLAVEELPIFPGFSAPDCLSRSQSTAASCGAAMTAARVDQRSRIALAAQADPDLVTIDLSALICPDSACPAVQGNVVTYRDDNHLTDPFARSLSWAIDRQLRSSAPLLYAG